jgi:predicted ATPase/DNA-binding CsgD family transcriptional regulator
MAAAVGRHYALLDEAILLRGGVRPVEQGEGDSVVAAFSRASDAVEAAVWAQRAFAAERWPVGGELRVRMALHTGEAQLRDEGNYFGQAVIRCARLRATGHGGQVLLSDSAAALVVGKLPEGCDLIDLGVHRLKDLARPERVWQIADSQLPMTFAPLRSLDAFRHNLPVQLTPLIGRESETKQGTRLLSDERLVTLTGAGGVGKTRLALAIAAEVLDRFAGGVWLVELAGVAADEGVAGATLAAIGAPQAGGVGLVEQVATELSDASCLVVLDNCEHLADACAELIAKVLSSCPLVSMLATSREPLGVPGEVTWRVPSLKAPPTEASIAVEALSQYDAVRLFIECAKRARPSFAVSEANAPAIAQICHRLDGIPLALELAAARCRQLSPERIAHDLDDRFRLLTGGARTALPRQQTLAASVDWSHDRLDPDEQRVFRRLGVFAGPFPLEAAEAVASSSGELDPIEVFDLVCRLADKSLIVSDDRDGEPRYRMLETLRAYAINRAREAGELGRLRQAHAVWWLGWLDMGWAVIHTDTVVDLVEEFHANLKAALDWSLDEPQTGLRLLRRLGRPWQNSGRPGEAMLAVDRLLTDDNAERYPHEWMMAANSIAVPVGTARGPGANRWLLETAERLGVALGDPFHTALAQWLQLMTPERCGLLRDLARDRGDRYVEALATIMIAQIRVDGDPAQAAAWLNVPEVVAAAQESSYLDDFADLPRALVGLCIGDLERSVEVGHKLVAGRSTQMADFGVRILGAAGLLRADAETLGFAVEVSERRLRKTSGTIDSADMACHCQELLRGGRPRVARWMESDAPPLTTLSIYFDGREAIQAGAAATALTKVRATRRDTPHGQTVLAAVEAAALDDENRWHDALRLAADHGLRLMAIDALEALAVSAARAESWTECLHLSAAAETSRDETGYRWRFNDEQQALDAAVAVARDALGTEAAAAISEGARLSWLEAVSYAQRSRGDRKRPRHGWASLTPTEKRVVSLVAEGLTNPQIAERLLMGRATVKTHLEHVFAKLGVTTRTDLAAQAVLRKT